MSHYVTIIVISYIIEKKRENLAYLASTTESQVVTDKNLAQNLASILLNLAQTHSVLLKPTQSCSNSTR